MVSWAGLRAPLGWRTYNLLPSLWPLSSPKRYPSSCSYLFWKLSLPLCYPQSDVISLTMRKNSLGSGPQQLPCCSPSLSSDHGLNEISLGLMSHSQTVPCFAGVYGLIDCLWFIWQGWGKQARIWPISPALSSTEQHRHSGIDRVRKPGYSPKDAHRSTRFLHSSVLSHTQRILVKMSPCSSQGHSSTERLCNWLKVTQLVYSRARTWI